jgi:iron complex transport system substrate-binding protein
MSALTLEDDKAEASLNSAERHVFHSSLLTVFFLLLCLTPYAEADEPVKPYSRIISLYSAHTENLFTLGAGSQIIGVSTSDDYPAAIANKPRFSYREDAEKFIAARPDLVLVRPMIERSYPQLLDKLKQAGITVVSLQPTSLDEIFPYWQSLGRLTGRRKEAANMIATFEENLAEMEARVQAIPVAHRPRVYFESIHKKMKTFAPGGIAVFVLEQAGGINVAGDARQVRKTNIASYGKERILSRADEIDIFLAQQGRMNPVSVEQITHEPGFQAIKAVREGKVYLIDEALVSRPGLRIVEGIRQLHSLLYPDQEN